MNIDYSSVSGSTIQNIRQNYSGKWLPAILLGLFYFNGLAPADVSVIQYTRWYLALVFALAIYLLQGKRIQARPAIIFWSIQGVALLGAVLSLFRATDFTAVSQNVIAMGVSSATIFLFLPTLATQQGRIAVLIAHLSAAVFWINEIQIRLANLGVFYFSTFSGTEDNKNMIALCLNLGGTALLAFALFWKPPEKFKRGKALAIRILAMVLSFVMYYSLSLIYSRSELLSAFVGILTVVAIFATRARGVGKFFRLISSTLIGIAIVVIMIPFVLSNSPYWEQAIQPLLDINEPTSMVARRELILKSLYIITDNPFIGIGPEQTKSSYSNNFLESRRGLIHNQYLAAWAELGLLGILSYCIFIIAYLKFFRRQFATLTVVDQVWLVVFIPYFFSLNFINVSTTMMLAIFSGIYYEWKISHAQASEDINKSLQRF